MNTKNRPISLLSWHNKLTKININENNQMSEYMFVCMYGYVCSCMCVCVRFEKERHTKPNKYISTPKKNRPTEYLSQSRHSACETPECMLQILLFVHYLLTNQQCVSAANKAKKSKEEGDNTKNNNETRTNQKVYIKPKINKK